MPIDMILDSNYKRHGCLLRGHYLIFKWKHLFLAEENTPFTFGNRTYLKYIDTIEKYIIDNQIKGYKLDWYPDYVFKLAEGEEKRIKNLP